MKESLIVIVIVIVFITLTIVGWSPAMFYLDKWTDYWDGEKGYLQTVKSTNSNDRWDRRNNAIENCTERTAKYFRTSTSSVASYAADSSKEYYTYDCYGVKLQKIP